MSWIQTYTGRKFDLVDPQPDMIDIRDIAHALSLVCRYTGHCSVFYSVAQHSVMVSQLVPDHLKVQALLHDATEAYVADLSRPLKSLLPEYRAIEDRVWRAIASRFDLPEKLDPAVKHADNVMLMAERRFLLGPQPEPWSADLEALAPEAEGIIVVAEPPHRAKRSFGNACFELGVSFA